MAFLLGFVLAVSSCREARERIADEQQIEHTTDSLAAAGGHGYYVVLYVVGRFKTGRVKGSPFGILVNRMDDRIREKPVGLLLMDTAHYELRYDGGAGVITSTGEFNKVMTCDDMEVLVSWPKSLMKMGRAGFEPYRSTNYEFVTYAY